MKSLIALILILPLLTQNGFVNLSGNKITLAENGKSEYVIVRDQKASIAMISAANSLSRAIKTKTGAVLPVVKDSEQRKSGAAGSYEILIGNTNRNSSVAKIPQLDAEDFYIRENDGALLVYAGSDGAYKTAEAFLSDNFMSADGFFIPDGYEYAGFKSYEIEDLTLPAGKINSYTLCYNGKYAKQTAESFAADILAKTGKSLKVSEQKDAKEPYIFFGDTSHLNDTAGWSVISENGNIFISSQNGMGLDAAYAEFTSALFNGDSKVAIESINKSGTLTFTPEFSEFMKLRTPLTNTYKKLTQDKKLNVAFFGGSVTNGFTPDGTDKHAWRQIACNWLEKNFPEAQINQIASAIGGSGSKLGAFRVGRDVIAHDPDLVFVEFSINDSYSTENKEQIKGNFEAVVRQIRKAHPDCDIVTLFITDSLKIAKTSFEQSEAHDEISALYGIDSVNLGAGFAKKTGIKSPVDPRWKTYFSDNVHMTAEGYAQYANVLCEYLADRLIFNAPKGAAADHPLPAAETEYAESEFQYILARDLEVKDSTGFKLSNDVFNYMKSGIYQGYYTPVSKENNLEFTFNGTELLLYMECPQNTHLYYTIDGKNEHYVHQIGMFYPATLLTDLTPGEHTISIRISGVSHS